MEYITFMLITIFMLMVLVGVVKNEVQYRIQRRRTNQYIRYCMEDYSYSSSRVLVQDLDTRH